MSVYSPDPKVRAWQQAFIRQRVEIDPSTECWNWTLSCNNKGYGMCKVSKPFRKQVTSHRLAYMAFNGPIPGDLFVCHTCDNRKCCNPDHLFLGTVTDNWHDRINKREAEGIYAIWTARQMRKESRGT